MALKITEFKFIVSNVEHVVYARPGGHMEEDRIVHQAAGKHWARLVPASDEGWALMADLIAGYAFGRHESPNTPACDPQTLIDLTNQLRRLDFS